MNSKWSKGVHDARFNTRQAAPVNFLIYLQNKRAHEQNLKTIDINPSKTAKDFSLGSSAKHVSNKISTMVRSGTMRNTSGAPFISVGSPESVKGGHSN